MQIYRLETEDGAGIYQRYWNSSNLAVAVQDNAEVSYTPGPDEEVYEGIRQIGYRAKFAFLSLEAMFNWFRLPEVFIHAQEAGITLAVYSVPDSCVWADQYQCTFDTSTATLIRRLPTTAVFEPHGEL